MADAANTGLIWSIAELLRGDYKQSDYGKVILPFTLLRRLDGVLAPTKAAVLTEHERLLKSKPVWYRTGHGSTLAGQLLMHVYVVVFLKHLLCHIPGKLLILWDGASIQIGVLC